MTRDATSAALIAHARIPAAFISATVPPFSFFTEYMHLRAEKFATMRVYRILFIILSALLALSGVDAFVPSPGTAAAHSSPVISGPFLNKNTPSLLNQENVPTAVTRQRRSVASVQTMGLFGLGLPEIALILVAAVFLVGPQKLGELVKESGKTAGELADELKNVPAEFQKGMEEGEMEARSRTAKQMKPVEEDDKKE